MKRVTHQLPLQENYYDLKKTLRALWQIQDSTKMELFPSPYQALFEITLGLQQIFTTRKLCLFQQGFHPYSDDLALRLARLGYRIEWIDRDGQKLAQFKEKSCEVLFVLYSADQPFTGEQLAPSSQDLFRNFPSFSLGLSFAGLKKLHIPLAPQQSFIHVLNDGRCAATLGGRFQVAFTLSAHLQSTFLELKDWTEASASVLENKALVEDFEKFAQDELGAQAFNFAGPRTFDRAVLDFPSVDGSALRAHLVEKSPEFATVFPLGLNYHRSAKSLKWMVQAGHSAEKLQGLVAFPAGVLSEDFKKSLRDSVQAVAELQNLSF